MGDVVHIKPNGKTVRAILIEADEVDLEYICVVGVSKKDGAIFFEVSDNITLSQLCWMNQLFDSFVKKLL